MASLTWVVPKADAVTLGELGGELYSVSPRDEAHVGDEFIRRGGAVFPPARVSCSKVRRPFGQEESLTQELEDEDALDSGALRMLKRAARAAKSFLLDDELQVLQSALEIARVGTRQLYTTVMGDADTDDAGAGAGLDAALPQQGENIADMSWHPTLSVLAVAQRDGVVSLYDVGSASWDSRVLEHPAQQDITSIQWGNFTGGVLAVACRSGLFLWKVRVKSKDEEPVLLEILKHPSKTGFYETCWSADGSLVAAFAKGSCCVIVFDTIFSRKTELQSPYQLASLHWSPTGEYLFVATESGVSLMWEALTWKRETWEVATGGCGWSSDGRCMLVAQRNSALLYPYIFQGCPPAIDAQISSPAIDFSEKEFFSSDRSTSAIVGGRIQNIAWDPTGSRVAVIYRSTGSSSSSGVTGELVAIFSVVWEPFLIFTRSGLLRGPPNAGVPRKVEFASSFEQGALLSVSWSSGLITFHPFYLHDRASK